jgi:starch synthase
LEGVLRARGNTIAGILNAVDYVSWNPETDDFIAAKYSSADLKGKAACKADLLAQFGLAADTRLPVVGIVSRFVQQKGFDLIHQVADRLAMEDLILVVLGSGQREYEDMFRRLAKQYPQKIAVKIAYDNALAHKIEAGSDIYLMPSHYEPCGLNQIYSLKYGTVPVVRATGGLDDTVEQFDPRTTKGTGFKFREYSGEAMLDALRAAATLYRDNPEAWLTVVRNGMAQDYSWTNSAREYGKVYERARQLKQQASGG